MKTTIATITLLFFSIFCFSQDSTKVDYKKFRTGNFIYLEGLYKGIAVKRTKHKQIETDQAVNKTSVLKIKWVSDNEYWLSLIKDSDGNEKKQAYKDLILKVKITSVNGNTYTYSWLINTTGKTGTGSMRKID